MCEISKDQRRKFRDQDPPRISGKSANDRLKDHLELSRSTPNSPTALQLASSLEKCFSEPGFFERRRGQNGGKIEAGGSNDSEGARVGVESSNVDVEKRRSTDDFLRELSAKVPLLSKQANKVTVNGLKRDSNGCEGLTNGRKMAPVLGVPPPPPPAPHMGPDGLILPRKPYNPCLTSTNHKDLRKELLFNQKVGKNVLNQKSELQRALEKQREAASRREAEKIREESYKDDPRTALQRAIEQRAKHIRLTQEQLQSTMEPPNNLLITARAKLRPRIDSQ